MGTLSNPAKPTGQENAHLTKRCADLLREAHSFYFGLMVDRDNQKERNERRAELDAESEKQSPGWVQKYLDLADILMRRRKHKRDDDHPKAA